MSAGFAKRPLLYFKQRSGVIGPRLDWRRASTQVGNRKRPSSLLVASGGILVALGLSPFYTGRAHADSETHLSSKSNGTSLGALIRSYTVYTICSIPMLVDHSPRLLELASIPALKWITEAFVRITFFDQFVGGDTAQKAIPLLRSLRAEHKGALFAYSVEVEEADATASVAESHAKQKRPSPHNRMVDEIIRGIDVAADFEDSIAHNLARSRRTWVAIKITALLRDASALIRLSSYLLDTRPTTSSPIPFPGTPRATDLDILYKPVRRTIPLNAEDIALLRDLHADLVRICTRAQERGVTIIIDAEYSWYQPALDAFTLSLTRQFNKLPPRGQEDTQKVQPLVYGTYQAYLRRTPSHLAAALADAKVDNYALGVKLVRGAYHPHELSAHAAPDKYCSISSDAEPPVWTSKSETDMCYNTKECELVTIRGHAVRHAQLGQLYADIG